VPAGPPLGALRVSRLGCVSLKKPGEESSRTPHDRHMQISVAAWQARRRRTERIRTFLQGLRFFQAGSPHINRRPACPWRSPGFYRVLFACLPRACCRGR
jgi:hypothetical protein